MQAKISKYPASYLGISLEAHETLITEKGAFIFSDGDYDYKNKYEIKRFWNWVLKIFGGKSLSYAVYTANSPLKIALATKDNSELFSISVENSTPVVFESGHHFARTPGLEVKLKSENWRNVLSDGFKLKTYGSGTLFLKAYGQIITEEIDATTPVYVDQDALVAFEDTLKVKTVSKGVKQLLTSGDGFLFTITGKGKIWIQTREKGKYSSGGGILEGIFNFMS